MRRFAVRLGTIEPTPQSAFELEVGQGRFEKRSPLAGMVATMCLQQGCQKPVQCFCCGKCAVHDRCQGQ